jgi:heme exporter protein A
VTDRLLTVRDVAVERGYRPLLADVTLDVAGGDLWQLVGANGIGKTSLLRGFAGLTNVGMSGDITRLSPPLYFGHKSATKLHLTPLENLRWHASDDVWGADQALIEALAEVGLAGYEDELVANLSAGQQRRVALARLWLTKARLWLLDEPFTAIDVQGASLLETRFVRHIETGGAIIFTSHQSNRFGDRLKTLDLTQYACRG